MMKCFRQYRAFGPLLVLIIALAFAVVALGYAKYKATDLGNHLGESTGGLVGTAIGSWKGVKEKRPAGIRDGREDARDNPEVTVISSDGNSSEDIFGAVKSTGKLEVLEASVQLENLHEIGEAYKSLELIQGNLIFSVDLNSAKMARSNNGRKLTIYIPKPEAEIFIDEGQTEKLAEKQNFSWSVSAEDEVLAYLNSRAAIVENAKEHIKNYDSLMEIAKESAIQHVQQLAENASLENLEIEIAVF